MTIRRRNEWANGPLYAFLMQIFPEHRNVRGQFDIARLATELSCSKEAVYQWLRGRRLKPSIALTLKTLAHQPGNLVALKTAGTAPPETADFNPFVYVD